MIVFFCFQVVKPIVVALRTPCYTVVKAYEIALFFVELASLMYTVQENKFVVFFYLQIKDNYIFLICLSSTKEMFNKPRTTKY